MAEDPEKSGTFAKGDVIAGRFRVTGTVGKGAMGAVYAAEHTGTGQQVALKFMALDDVESGDGDSGAEFVKRFEQEARVMAALRSPNTVRIYDFGANADGSLFMAMELLHGQPLDKRIRELVRQGTTMPESEACVVGIQVLRSLVEAHGQGLVHRDLKPGNVFLTDDGTGDVLAKVLDFGIARIDGSNLTGVGKLLGTPAYMSPEQWRGERPDGRSDLYAMGCILYCCVTGKPPFQADNPMALLKAHMVNPVPDPRTASKTALSDGFVQVVRTALAKDPAERFADARSMRVALEAVAGGAWAGTPSAARVGSGTFPAQTAGAVEPDQLPTMALAGATERVTQKGPKTRVLGGPEASKPVGLIAAVAVAGLALAGLAAWWLTRATPVPASAPPVPALAPRVPEPAPPVPALAPRVPEPAPPVPAFAPRVPEPAPPVPTFAPRVPEPAPPVPTFEPPAPVAAKVEAQNAARPTAAKPAAKPGAKKRGGAVVEEMF